MLLQCVHNLLIFDFCECIVRKVVMSMNVGNTSTHIIKVTPQQWLWANFHFQTIVTNFGGIAYLQQIMMVCDFDTQIIHTTKCFYSYDPKTITFNDQHHTFATIAQQCNNNRHEFYGPWWRLTGKCGSDSPCSPPFAYQQVSSHDTNTKT